MNAEHQRLAVDALHKLQIEIGRGTAQPKAEYEWAFAQLDDMKASVDFPRRGRAHD